MRIPFLDLKRQYRDLAPDIDLAVQRVLEGGVYILGTEVDRFELEWADFCGVGRAATVNSGTDALTLALIGSGAVREDHSEVITSPLTAAYTGLSILNAGGTPVFADIDPQTFTLDPNAIEKALTSRTRAIVPVHLYGRMADMKAIYDIADAHDLVVVEDACQAHGLRLLTDSDKRKGRSAAVFSFYPTKNLGAFGDGGAVVSNEPELIDQIKILRQGGHEVATQREVLGLNSRMDEIQAAILRVKLKKLQAWNDTRRHLAHIYTEGLQNAHSLEMPSIEQSESHVQHLYVVKHRERERMREHLLAKGIGTMIHYPTLLHQQPLFKRSEQNPLPHAEEVVKRIVSLPLYPELTTTEVENVIDAILEFGAKP